MAYSIFRPKRGTASDWRTANPILKEGEMGIEFPDSGVGTGTSRIKFGDGAHTWNELPYSVSPEIYFGDDSDAYVKKSDLHYSNEHIAVITNRSESNTVSIENMKTDIKENEDAIAAINSNLSKIDNDGDGVVTNSLNLNGHPASFYTAFLYKAPLTIAGWTGDGPYVQVSNLYKNNAEAPDVTANSVFVSGPMGQKSTDYETNKGRLEALNVINMGYATLGSNSVTVTCHEKPKADINIFWLIKEQG